MMSRRPAVFIQADYARAIRAGKKAGLSRVEIRFSDGNTIVFPLSGDDSAQAMGNDNKPFDETGDIVLW
jgi:hypothetical protein